MRLVLISFILLLSVISCTNQKNVVKSKSLESLNGTIWINVEYYKDLTSISLVNFISDTECYMLFASEVRPTDTVKFTYKREGDKVTLISDDETECLIEDNEVLIMGSNRHVGKFYYKRIQ